MSVSPLYVNLNLFQSFYNKKNMRKIRINFFKRVLTDTIYDDSIRDNFFKNSKMISKSQMNSILKKQVDEQSKTGS